MGVEGEAFQLEDFFFFFLSALEFGSGAMFLMLQI